MTVDFGEYLQDTDKDLAEIAVRFEINIRELNDFAQKGVDLVWTSQHPNCSPRCKDFQGKLWSISGKSGVIDGIPYRPLAEAIQGKQKDGNGIITGYNCRHRLIEYKKGSRPPQELSEAQIKKEYAIDTRMRAYENRIRQMKTEEKLLRSVGAIDSAKELRKKWRKETLEYKAFAFENGRAFERARCVVDESELNFEEFYENELTNDVESGILNISGAKNSSDYQSHGAIRYPFYRKITYDVERIAKNTGYTVEQIQKVKNYLFIDKHDLGGGELKQFDPDDDIATSWDMLFLGQNIRPHDLTLLKHEIMEQELVDGGMDRNAAHVLASYKYNFKKESSDYVDDKKVKKD